MEEIEFSDIDILDFGNEIQTAGMLWTGKGQAFITLIPQRLDEDLPDLKLMPLTLEQWLTMLKQTDILETAMFNSDPSGLVKTIFRKTQRQIDGYVQWAVFKRDNYTCRYCGRTGLPLTVDHVDIYELGGVTIPENLITSCKNCNKERGRMNYRDWLNSAQYKRRSVNLSDVIKQINLDIVSTLPHLETLRVINIRTR